MSQRSCTKCGRPCLGHEGPTGEKCNLTTIEELIREDDPVDRKLENKLSILTDQISTLTSALTGLVSQVNKIEARQVGLPTQTPSPSPTQVAKGEKLIISESLTLPKPSWNTVGVASGGISNSDQESEGKAAHKPDQAEGKTVQPDNASAESGTIITTQSLARDSYLAKLLRDYNDIALKDILTIQESSQKGENPTKKVLLIPDFVVTRDGDNDSDEETLVFSQGNLRVKSKNKPTLREVTVAQWISANISILEILRETFSPDQLSDYLQFTKQIGDYLQIYTVPSVLALDNQHRKDVFKYGHKWSDISIHHISFYLVRIRMGHTANGSSTNNQAPRQKRKGVCHKFNSTEGCTYGSKCRYPHVCSVSGCGGNHPSMSHPNKSSFRSEANQNR